RPDAGASPVRRGRPAGPGGAARLRYGRGPSDARARALPNAQTPGRCMPDPHRETRAGEPRTPADAPSLALPAAGRSPTAPSPSAPPPLRLPERLDPSVFQLPAERMREGYYSDKYFVRAREVLEHHRRDPVVTMQ